METVSRETLEKWLFVEEEYINEFCERNRLSFSDDIKNSLLNYAKWIWNTNQSINLVSRKDEVNILRRHICHALSINILFPDFTPSGVIDLGTGGGIPGVPFYLTTQTPTILIDSIQKKITALESYITDNKLSHIHAVRARIEEVNSTKFKNVDSLITRGVAPIHTILDWTTHLREGKRRFIYLFLKGGFLEDEFETIPIKIKREMKDISVKPIEHFGANFIGEEKYIIKIKF